MSDASKESIDSDVVDLVYSSYISRVSSISDAISRLVRRKRQTRLTNNAVRFHQSISPHMTCRVMPVGQCIFGKLTSGLLFLMKNLGDQSVSSNHIQTLLAKDNKVYSIYLLSSTQSLTVTLPPVLSTPAPQTYFLTVTIIGIPPAGTGTNSMTGYACPPIRGRLGLPSG